MSSIKFWIYSKNYLFFSSRWSSPWLFNYGLKINNFNTISPGGHSKNASICPFLQKTCLVQLPKTGKKFVCPGTQYPSTIPMQGANAAGVQVPMLRLKTLGEKHEPALRINWPFEHKWKRPHIGSWRSAI